MLRRLITGGSESRAVTPASLFLSDRIITGGTRAGVAINDEVAFAITPVYAAIRLIADQVSTLPVDTFIRRNGARVPYRPKPMWVDQPEPDRSVQRSDHYQALMVSLLVAGESFTRILRNEQGDVVALTVLDPRRVRIERDPMGLVTFIVDNTRRLSEDEVIHITELRRPGSLHGVSRIDELKETLGLTRALELWSAQFFGSGSTTSGVIEVPGEVTQQQAKELQNAWEEGHKGFRKAHRPGILSGGATFKDTSIDPEKSQLLQAREFAVEEVARAFRIPVFLLGSTKPGAVSYASAEENNRVFGQYTLRPYIHKIEEAYSRLLPGDVFLRMNMDALLRANLSERFAAYSQGVQAGFLSINDIHRIEDMSPVDGGDVYRVPLANVNLDAANITETSMRVDMATKLVNVGFAPESVLAALGLPTVTHTGLPSVQLQNAAQQAEVNADDTAADTEDVYPANRSVEPEEIAEAISGALRAMPAPVVNVSLPESPARSKRLERDADGNITAIIEEQ